MQGKTKVSVSVQARLLREVDRVAGEASRSAIFDQALAHWLRERRRVQLERDIEAYYHSLGATERAEDDAWAASCDDAVRRAWDEPTR